MAYQSIYAGKTNTLPGAQANSFANDFTPGQYLVKNQPKQSKPSKPADTPQPAPSLAARGSSILSKIGSGAKKVAAPFVRPVVAVATGKGGKAVHDTAQLSADLTGGAPNYLLKTAIANPIKETTATLSGNKVASKNARTQSNKDLGLGDKGKDIKHGLIKLGAETALTASLGVGGSEAKAATTGAKSLLNKGGTLSAKQSAKSVGIGATGNVAATVANNPNATKKDIAKSALLGGALGGIAPVALKGVGKAGEATGKGITKLDNKVTGGVVTNGQPTRDLIANTRTQSLLDAGRNVPKTVNADVATAKSINTIMDKIRTPKSVIDDAKAQAEATATNQKNSEKIAVETQKAAEQTKKIDNQIELVNAKKADGKFTNVDKVKVKQLEGQKQELAGTQPTSVTTVSKGSTTPAIASSSSAVDTNHPLVQSIDKYFKGGKAGPEEAKALDYVRSNPDKVMANYDKIAKNKFGATNIVSGDEAKYAIPGFTSLKSTIYHEPASALAKAKYAQLLADPATKDKPVLLMAGGSGAGKTSALKNLGINHDNYAAVVDTNSNKLDSAKARIRQAVDSGRQVEVFYVHRDPVKSFSEGVIPRGKEEGRIVPIDTHIDTHYGSHEVIHQLAKDYKNHPSVDFTIADNNRGHGKAGEIGLDEIPKMSYTKDQIKPILQKEVDNAHKQGTISTEEHSLYHGREQSTAVPKETGQGSNRQSEQKRTSGSQDQVAKPQKVSARKQTEYKPNKAEPTSVPIEQPKIEQPEIKTSKLANRVEAIAIKKDLASSFADKPEYAKVNMSKQAEAAANLLKENPEQLQRIAMGQERPPEGLLPESAWVAAIHNAQKTDNAQALLDLGTRSHLVSEASGMGQRIRALGELDNGSPAKHIKDIADVGNKAFEKKTGQSFDKAVKQALSAAKKEIVPVKAKDWNSLIEALKC